MGGLNESTVKQRVCAHKAWEKNKAFGLYQCVGCGVTSVKPAPKVL